MGEPEAFFERTGGGRCFRATALARGPWSADHAHGGPPAALCARAIERRLAEAAAGNAEGGEGAWQVARLRCDFPRPVPLGEDLVLEVGAVEVGRRVARVEVTLVRSAGGKLVCRVAALAVRRVDGLSDPGAAEQKASSSPSPAPPEGAFARGGPNGPEDAAALPAPDSLERFRFPFFAHAVGYHTAMDVRITRGRWGAGPVTAWMRMGQPLLEAEGPSPLQRVAIAADSGHGLAIPLDLARYTFVNPDLDIALDRLPEGDWVCLDACSRAHVSGVGLAQTRVLDRRGEIGRTTQILVIERR